MIKLRPGSATILVFVILLVGIGVGEAKSVNFLERKKTEIDGEDSRRTELKSNGLYAPQDPFELAAARIRVSVQQLRPSQMVEKDTSKTDSDLVAALSHGPVSTITLTPTNATSVGHRSSPSSAELVDPSIDEYSVDPFDGTGKGVRSEGEFKQVTDQMLRPPPPSLKP